MNIGDKVRLVHGKEEGVIYAFLPGNVVEIEIEDGFRIPVMKNEIVTISPIESQRMRKDQGLTKLPEQATTVASRQAAFSEKGIYLAFVAVNDRTVILHLINNSDWNLPFTAATQQGDVHAGLASGALQPRTSQKLMELEMKDFESWPVFDFTMLYFRAGSFKKRNVFEKKLKFRAQTFFKSKKMAPVLSKEAFVFQLDEEVNHEKIIDVRPNESLSQELRERLMGGTEPPKIELEKPAQVIDLHVEKLVEDFTRMTKEDILRKQLEVFESGFELAIANGMDEITFIHGSGNGVLRNELHRRLSKHPHVQYYKDAQKEKFGFGATLIKIK